MGTARRPVSTSANPYAMLENANNAVLKGEAFPLFRWPAPKTPAESKTATTTALRPLDWPQSVEPVGNVGQKEPTIGKFLQDTHLEVDQEYQKYVRDDRSVQGRRSS
jgi:hypothetical protein